MKAIQALSQKSETSTETSKSTSEIKAEQTDKYIADLNTKTSENITEMFNSKSKEIAASATTGKPIQDENTRANAIQTAANGGGSALGAAMGMSGGVGSGNTTNSSSLAGVSRTAALGSLTSRRAARGIASEEAPSTASGGEKHEGGNPVSDLAALLNPQAAEGMGPEMAGPIQAGMGAAGPGRAMANRERGPSRVIDPNAPLLPGPLSVIMKEQIARGSVRPVSSRTK